MSSPEVDVFESQRRRLFGIAYRMLGSVSEAEDMVQETFLRYQACAPEAIRSPSAFLTTVVTRLCLTQLTSARARREAYVGLWLPEPVLSEKGAALDRDTDPVARQAELHESISLAFLVLLEQLTPAERAVFLLREVFDYSYGEIATIIEKDEGACRQLFSRAKKRLAADRPRFSATAEHHHRLLAEFVQAVNGGALEGLMQLLAEDVTLWADGGGKTRGAVTRPLHGRTAVARFVLASTRYLPPDASIELVEVNGQPAVLVRVDTQAMALIALEVDQSHVRGIRVIGNPDKLRAL
jgi:RNA polymerase sigma-70 factor, ECF subfamily